MLDVDKEVAAMQRMTVNELRDKFAKICGEQTKGRNKQWLIKRITWRMQANEYGGLSERALQRARELANFSDLRLMSPRPGTSSALLAATPPISATRSDNRLPKQGTILTRKYKGRTLEVEVLDDGFAFDGQRYQSLTAVAKAITGSHWNGFLFFGLKARSTA